MPSHRMQHACESIKRELTAIIRCLNDPRVRNNFIDLVKIDISKDMSICTVYVSSIDGLTKATEAVDGLNSAVSYIRRELGHRLELRFIPNVRFKATDSIEYGISMMEKINNLNEEKKMSMSSLGDVANLLKNKDKFCIFTHKYPDGDAVGSAYALCRTLQNLGKKVKILMEDDVPTKYAFLEKYIKKEDFEPEFIISVDVADVHQLGESMCTYFDKINLCIDHHITNKRYADVTFVDSTSSATSEIIYEIIKELGLQIDKEIAECLYTGISTDTGCFKYSNVTAKTHRIVADLIDKNINLGPINRLLFDTKPKNILKLELLIYNSLEYFFQDKCVLVIVTPDMLESAGVEEKEVDGIASIPRGIEGVEVGVTIRQKESELYKVSVRTSEKVSASDICEQFGGGGHVCASGFTFEGKLDELRTQILNCIEKKI